MTRRRLLAGGAGLAAAAAGGGGFALGRAGRNAPADPPAAPAALRQFLTRPDLAVPVVDVAVTGPTAAGPGLPHPGRRRRRPRPAAGRRRPASPVWFHQVTGPGVIAIDARVQRLAGQPVITWWEGTIDPKYGIGAGEFVIVDRALPGDPPAARARTGAGRPARPDPHPAGHARSSSRYEPAAADLSAFGGPADGVAGRRRALRDRRGHRKDRLPVAGPRPHRPGRVLRDAERAGSPTTICTPTRSRWTATARCWSRPGTPGRSTRSTGVPARSAGGSAASRATSRSARTRRSPGSTTPAGARTAPSACSTTRPASPTARTPRAALILDVDETARTARAGPRAGTPGRAARPEPGFGAGIARRRVAGRLGTATPVHRVRRRRHPGRQRRPAGRQRLVPGVQVRLVRHARRPPGGGRGARRRRRGHGPRELERRDRRDGLAGPRGPATGQRSRPTATAARTGFETALPIPGPAVFVAVDALDRSGTVLASSPLTTVPLS